MDKTVKAISRAPRNAASQRGLALFDVAGDVFDHHDGVVHHKARGDGEGHEGEVVQAVAAEIHDPEGADERDRHRHPRDEGGPDTPQEGEHHQDYQDARDHQGAFDILQRTADGRAAVHRDRDVDILGNGGLQLGQQAADPVHRLDDVGPGRPEDDHHHRGLAVHQTLGAHILQGILDLAQIRQPHRRPVAEGHDQIPVLPRP